MDSHYTPLKQDMNKTSIFSKLKVVTWKNLIIRKHHWFLSLCEIAIPIVLFVLIAYVRSKIDALGKHYVTTPTYSQQVTSDLFYSQRFNHETRLFYCPDTGFTDELIRNVQLKFQLNTEAITGFKSESDLLAYYETFAQNATVMGIVFKGLKDNEPPKHLDYVVRPFEKYVDWETQALYDPTQKYIQDYGSSNYIYKGFIALKMALDTSFIEMASKKEFPYTLTMQEFPYPPYLNDEGVTDMFLYVLPLVTLFSFVFLCPAVLKRIVEEKSTGIKELMKMMGLKSWMLWLGWFLHAFIVNGFSICIITFFMKVSLWNAQYPPIEHCSWSVLLIFLLLYCAAGITFCFAISSFFNRPTLAMMVGIFAWILSSSVPSALLDQSPGWSWGTKVLFGIFPNAAMSFGYKAISVYEMREVGAHWYNLFQSASGGRDDVTMGNVFVMFVIDIVVYVLITVYVENVKPGPYGLAKPFHYPLSFAYDKLSGLLRRKSPLVRSEEDNEQQVLNKYCKIEPAKNLTPGIQVKNLHKTYGKQTAVNDLSINIYEGQITALLGHNGAGKTTTMSIITGMTGATSGRVLIKGLDITKCIDTVRSSLGLCPQHNLQFADLTVMEHLIFFAMLKGLSNQQATKEANELLQRLNLSTKSNCLASSLSGGMRRKLSLGIALIGDSKVLILDEPTSGLDPEARREIWDMLLSMRGSKTILITTHFMEEADVLGDRIAIMDHGRLICYGTPLFLKSEYGTGYHLTLIRDESKQRSLANEGINQTAEMIRLVKSKIEKAEVKANSASHLTFLLPHHCKSLYSELLATLESEKERLGISNITISVTTLEEVFLRVGSIVSEEDKKALLRPNSISSSTSSNSSSSHHSLRSNKSIGGELVKLQLFSLLKKRARIMWKRKLNFFCHVLGALFVTILTLYQGETVNNSSAESFPTFNFDLGKYGENKVFYGGVGADPDLTQMERIYADLTERQKGDSHNVSSVSDALIKEGVANIAFYKQHIVAAAEFNSTEEGKNINAMYSNLALHGAPISLNLLMNAVVKVTVGDDYSITSANNPLPVYAGMSLEEASEIQVAIVWFMWFPLGLLFLASTFLVFPQMERVSNIKQLQLMCGVRSVSYWLVCYVFDLVFYIGAVLLILLTILLYSTVGSKIFSGWNEILAVLVILIAYGIPVIPYSYLFSYKRTVGGGIASFLIISMFASISLTIVVLVLEMSGEEYYEHLGKTLKHLLVLFPQFGLTYTSVQFSRKAVWNYNWLIKPEEHRRAICKHHPDPNPCCDGYDTEQCRIYRSYFHGDKSIGPNALEMAASFTIYFALLMILETTFIHRSWSKIMLFYYNLQHSKKSKNDVPDGGKDVDERVDVKEETDRVYSTLEREKRKRNIVTMEEGGDSAYDDDLLLVHKLEKAYWGQKAVKGVSFGVKAGDCFGLLGVNGAGKTTTFRMLTGDEPLIAGDARIKLSPNDFVHISKDSKKYLEHVGYCPQFDAINELLTGREMLQLFGQLRGLHEDVDHAVNRWLEALGLEEYADKPCGEYSGGNKRKLSMALALIGNPLLVMLDEPTSGVDPVSRRKLWDIVTEIQQQTVKPSILLTSHSMEECEALCNKLAIMKAGELECYGTIPSLKKKFGQGYTVMLKLNQVPLNVKVDTLNEDNQSTAMLNAPETCTIKRSRPDSHSNKERFREEDSEEVKQVMEDFEKKYRNLCTLRDKHSGLLHYHISDKNKRWSELFEEIEAMKRHHSVIEDYNISETTLEEVFLSIARSEAR